MALKGRFALQRGTDFQLNVQFELPSHGVTALFGHSGSGKTTILRCIAGLERCKDGFFQFNEAIWQQDKTFIATHKRPIGYVFQEASLFPHLSVQQNLKYGLQRTPLKHRKIVFEEVINLLGIERFLHRNPVHLSGGERQRVAIARALLTSPLLLLMDEPLAALDANSKAEILPYLEKLHAELSIPVLYITHSLTEVMKLADYILMLEHGKIIAEGALLTVLTRLDLPLLQTEEYGVAIEAKVIEHDEEFRLTYLTFLGGKLSLHLVNLPIGSLARVRVLARDVSISLDPEPRSSILNIFQATIIEIAEDTTGHWLIKLAIYHTLILARISRKSGIQLNLKVGQSVYARVKGVALI